MIEITEAMEIEIRKMRGLRPIGSIRKHNISWRHIPEGEFYSVRASHSTDVNEGYRAFMEEGEAKAFAVLIG